jgi:hypothetical protein
MKKSVFILGLFLVVALSSCNKEKDCECVSTYSGTGTETMADVTTTMTIQDGDCSDMDVSVTSGDITTSMTCTEQ